MTETQLAIADAIVGGWNPWAYGWPISDTKDETWKLHGEQLYLFCKVYAPEDFPKHEGPWRTSREFWVHITRPLLDPRFWEALGKTRGWGEAMGFEMHVNGKAMWNVFMLSFMQYLADGKTIEEAFNAIVGE